MRERSRRALIVMALLTLVVTITALVVLRLGRPLYYGDGTTALLGARLSEAPVILFDRPEPWIEIPGPVMGRVARQADGRLIYGMAQPGGTADLVRFDPARPELAPERILGLNTKGHELAPAIGPGGRLFFASDRPGGAGGFDLYWAPPVGDGYGPVRSLGKQVNTALDETDPAPDPHGANLVFVRRDPGIREGRNGLLMWCGEDESKEATPLWTPARGEVPPLDRDPLFSPGGEGLWFVREGPDGDPKLRRTWRQAEGFIPSLPVPELARAGTYRSPIVFAAGFKVGLLGPGKQPLLYVTSGQQVFPWWGAQKKLEALLLSLVGFSVVLLFLLVLGRRWRKLDLITQCLLLSLIVHIFLLLWLARVEIVRHFKPDPLPGDGRIKVRILAQRDDNRSGGVGQAQSDISREVQYTPEKCSIAASLPGSKVASSFRPITPSPGGARQIPQQKDLQPQSTQVVDQRSVKPRQGGADSQPAVTASQQRVEKVQAPVMVANKSARAKGEEIVLTMPGTSLPAQNNHRAPLTVAGKRDYSRPTLPASSMAVVKGPALSDAPSLAVPTAVKKGAVSVALPQPVGVSPAGPARGASPPVPSAGVVSSAGRVKAAAPAPVLPAGGKIRIRNSDYERVSKVRPGKMTAPVAKLRARSPSLTRRGPSPAAEAEALLRPIALGAMPSGPMTRNDPTAGHAGFPRNGKELGQGALNLPGSALAATKLAAPEAHERKTRTLPGPTGGGTPLASLRDIPQLEPAKPTSAELEPARAGLQPAPISAPEGPADYSPPKPVRRQVAAMVAPSHPGDLSLPESKLATVPLRQVAMQRRKAVPLSLYSNRFGPRKKAALKRYGGSGETEEAVRSGLAYLARQQNRAGSWGVTGRGISKYGQIQVGKSALCLLAFLGAGHTPESGTEYSGNVTRGLAYLLRSQDQRTGHFGHTSSYSQGIATYALAECFAITHQENLAVPIARGVQRILDQQTWSNRKHSRGGWGYFSPTLRREDSYSRASITAWMVMALESAQRSGLKLPESSLAGAKTFLYQCFDARRGYFLYNRKPSRLRSSWRTLPASTPAAVFSLFLLGEDGTDPRMQAGLQYTLSRKPKGYRRYSSDAFVTQGAGNVYYWYYGTLAAFMAGGEAWQEWNRALKRVIPPAQLGDGSFPPIGVYAEYAGDNSRDRSFTTAMCVLSLEVYYRYFTPLLKGKGKEKKKAI